MRLRQWVAAIACLAAPSLSAAQSAPTPKPTIDLSPDLQQRFSQADLDHSGGLSKGEAASGGFVEEQFDDIDTDHDHVITLYEIGTYVAQRTRDWATADTDGDGQVTREEAERVPSLKSIFTKADRDGDGVVRREEHEAFSETTLYQNLDLPYVVPNIINKKF